jgi:hypothetical protein
MEKVKAGDAVELRVYSAGQTRTVRVESAKASEVGGEGFFFNGTSGRMMTIPRVRVRPPSVEFDDFPMRFQNKAELESRLRSLRETLRSTIEPSLKLRSQLQSELQKKVSVLRSATIL